MPRSFATLPHALTLALACVAPACITEDELDDRDRLAEDIALDDDDLDDDDLDDDDDAPAAELGLASTDDAAEGGQCHQTDSNGPLPGGTITVTGCNEGETCVLYACGGYSCVGTCHAGGGWSPK